MSAVAPLQLDPGRVEALAGLLDDGHDIAAEVHAYAGELRPRLAALAILRQVDGLPVELAPASVPRGTPEQLELLREGFACLAGDPDATPEQRKLGRVGLGVLRAEWHDDYPELRLRLALREAKASMKGTPE